MALPLNLDLDFDNVRERLGRGLFAMVAGPEGPQNRSRIHDTPGPRWFADDRPIRRVHADASMFVGGLRALLLQRTSTFLAVTTFGTATDAQRAVDKVRGIHRRVRGQAPDGRDYQADDPHLLEWVHIAEVDSFLQAYQLYGAAPLDQAGRDDYVADTARVAAALGVLDPPRTEADLRTRLAGYRSELYSTEAAREAARFLLITPPLSLLARAPYGVLAASAVSMLPPWARLPLRLPYLPPLEATAIRLSGRVLVSGIRWALSANQPDTVAAQQL